MKRIGVVGTKGLVGEEVIRLLEQKNLGKLSFFGRDETDFSELDTLFLCTPSNVSKTLALLGIDQGALVIDLSSAFRKTAPLLLPPINGYLLENSPPLVACPNCIVAILLMVLGPLHKKFEITKIQMTTYQAASGAGREGLLELAENRPPKVFPYPLHENLFLHESPTLPNGYSEEEEKIIFETKKILETPDLKVNVRAVRVPVLRAHSIAANVTFKENPEGAEEILQKTKGIQFHPSPHPKLAESREEVFYGPIRKDLSTPNTLDFWIVGDQLLRGAALTAVEVLGSVVKFN